MSEQRARDLGITRLARILATDVTGLSPEIMGLGPVQASEQALARAGLTIDDVDLVEINEAFAAQVLPSFGMTGARITATLLNALATRDKTIGLETMCVGGGQGMAMVLQRLS